MKRNPHWVAIVSLILTVALAIIAGSVAYGEVNKQVEINTDNIGELDAKFDDTPTRSEYDTMKDDLRDIKANVQALTDYLLKKNS